MSKTKLEVDRHVEQSLKRKNNEAEKNDCFKGESAKPKSTGIDKETQTELENIRSPLVSPRYQNDQRLTSKELLNINSGIRPITPTSTYTDDYGMKDGVTDFARVKKIKEDDEQQIAKLNREISQMKSLKANQEKQMREESNKYRQWRIQKDLELQELKEENQKKQTEIENLKVQHRQTAENLNKRLNDQLALRIAKISDKVERRAPWLKRKLEVFRSSIEAEMMLTSLLEDRGLLEQQLDEVKSSAETAEPAETKALEKEIELKSVQIFALRQKLVDLDEGSESDEDIIVVHSSPEETVDKEHEGKTTKPKRKGFRMAASKIQMQLHELSVVDDNDADWGAKPPKRRKSPNIQKRTPNNKENVDPASTSSSQSPIKTRSARKAFKDINN